MKLAYIGIDAFCPALTALAEAGCEIAELFTCQTDNEVDFNLEICAFARRSNIPLTVGRIVPEDLRRLRERGCSALICGGYYHRVPVDEGLPAVNLHPSLLPVGRGPWPMPGTIMRGLSRSGVTAHKMTRRFDEGDILLQESFPVAPDEDLETLLAKQRALLPGMMRALAVDFDRLYAQAVPQGAGEYWPDDSDRERVILPDMTARQADLRVRAYYGYGVIARFPGGDTLIKRGRVRPEPAGAPGTLCEVRSGVWAASIKDGSIWFKP